VTFPRVRRELSQYWVLMLHIHRAERADGLVRALGDLLSVPPADPFAAEVVAVPARGMERWLTQQLSSRLGSRSGRADGVCANVAFPSPQALVSDAVALASGIAPEADPWRPERAIWPLLDVVEHALGEPWALALSTHLGHGADPPEPHREARRLSTVRHLAELFHRYALQRPELVRAWADGGAQSGGGTLAPSSAPWQAELWRRLQARIPLPDPAERLSAACARLRAEPELLALPERISLFGLTRLPAGYLHVLHALAAGREVHLFVLHPSPALWTAVGTALPHPPPALARGDDPTTELPAHPLLRSWGRDGRELQLVLSGSEPYIDHRETTAEPEPNTLLARIRADIRADRPPPGAPLDGRPELRAPLAPADHSIQVHSCHGRARQVEVVRDAVLHALDEDPTLEPRDVIVMCPEIETFAPLIQATFGTAELAAEESESAAPAIDLRVRLADRSLRKTNPVLGVLATLMELAGGRFTASQLLDLADREPVRRRFALDDDALGRLQSWIADAGVRWGLDREHRAPFKLEALPNGTWRAGLDRLLLGVTMTEDGQRLLSGVLPLDDVDSGAIDLAGRLAELVSRLGAVLDRLSTPQPLAAWAQAIAAGADALTHCSGRDAWQRAQLQRILDELVAESAASDARLALPEIRALLAERLRSRPTRANFRTGHLTVCTLVPMRSVPHRVVCLLGLDDGAFPRRAPRDGDDVMLECPQIGERDPRSEDRQLLLDALMAAGEQLIVTYTGNDERTNQELPPAVPIGELLDAADATAVPAAGADGEQPPARAQILIRHPLQPFDRRNFTPGALSCDGPWSFDPVALGGAEAILSPRRAGRPFLEGPLPARDGSGIDLDDLIRFVQHPVKAFLRQRLQISLSDRSEEIADELPVKLDGLERWGVGQRLLEAQLAGIDRRSAGLAEIARGALPPGELGLPVIREIYPVVDAIAETLRTVRGDGPEPEPVDIHLTLGDGRTLTGTVPGVSGSAVLTSTYSRLAAKHRIVAWVRLLALTAADPALAYTAASIGRGRGDSVAVRRIRCLGADEAERRAVAHAQLDALIDLYDRGMREPLPIFCRSSAEYAAASAAGRDASDAALGEWLSTWNFDREDRELEHLLVLGGERTLAEVMETVPASDEYGAGWDPSEGSRFGRLACRLWDGLLDHEDAA
jgi:exodeoxyribonuclease V gamma subunit